MQIAVGVSPESGVYFFWMGQLIEKRVAFLQVLGGKKKSNTKRVGIPKGNHFTAGVKL